MTRNKIFGIIMFIALVVSIVTGVICLIVSVALKQIELLEISKLLLFASGGAIIGAATATVTIVDDLFS